MTRFVEIDSRVFDASQLFHSLFIVGTAEPNFGRSAVDSRNRPIVVGLMKANVDAGKTKLNDLRPCLVCYRRSNMIEAIAAAGGAELSAEDLVGDRYKFFFGGFDREPKPPASVDGLFRERDGLFVIKGGT